MNKYEVLYIVENTASDEVKEGVLKRLEAAVTNAGGTVDGVDKWGTKRFAYPINFKNEGYYVLLNITAPADVPAEIDRQVRIIPEAIRVMVTRKDA